MRIFMLVPPPVSHSPIPKHTAHLVAELRGLGCTVVTRPWGRATENESFIRKLIARTGHVLSVKRAVAREDFDAAVVKTAHDWRTVARDLVVVHVIRRRCRPVVLQLHGSRASMLAQPGHRAFKFVTRRLLELVDGIMVLSTEEQREWLAFHPEKPVFTVRNPYVRVQLHRQHNDPGARAQILFVGRLMEEKGVFDLVEAFARVREQKQCRLVVAGEGKDERELRDRIDRLGLADDVTITGYLSGAALSEAYRTATLFALPTRWDEGFPTVLAEAMDAGLPIITTRIRGAADHLVSGENALFVPARDVAALTSAILALLDDAPLRARMRAANQKRLELFDPEVVARDYLGILQSLVSRTANDGEQRRVDSSVLHR